MNIDRINVNVNNMWIKIKFRLLMKIAIDDSKCEKYRNARRDTKYIM